MSQDENQIAIEIKMEDGSFRKAWVDLESDSKKSGEKVGTGFGSGYIKAATAAIAAIGSLFAVKEFIKQATQQEDAVNGLNSALKVAGQFSAAASDRFQQFASSLQRSTTASDDAILSGGALLVTLGKLSGQGLENATKASLDLAAGLGIDTASAFNIMSKAATGNVSVLGRYGIKVQETGNATADFANALAKVNDTFGGRAEAKLNTFSGAMGQMTGQFDEILEGFGMFIIKSPQVVAAIKFVAGKFAEFADFLGNTLKQGNPLDGLVKSAANFAVILARYVMPPVELLFNSLRTGFLVVATGISGLVTALLYVKTAIFQYLEKPLYDFIGGNLAKLVGFFDKDLGASINKFVTDATASTAAGLESVRDKAGEITGSIAEKMVESANAGFDFSASAGTERFLTELQSAVDQAKPIIENGISKPIIEQLGPTWDYIVDGFKNTFSKAALTSVEFRDQLAKNVTTAFTTFRNGFTSTFAAMGKAWQEGTSVIGAFGKAVLGLFGDLALQLGTFYFLMGLGNMWINPAAGAAQIAAGIGLSVLGGVLKSMSGSGGGESSAGAGGGGGGVAAPSSGISSQSSITQERQEPQSSVVVNVQGHVLDNKGTGLALADIIRENFELAGVTTVGGR